MPFLERKNVGSSKFAELRPPHCVLAGASGTHSMCVCTIHQNMKLMFLGARLSEEIAPESISSPTYHHCLAPLPTCYLELMHTSFHSKLMNILVHFAKRVDIP